MTGERAGMMPFMGYRPERSRYRKCVECDVRWSLDWVNECFVCGVRGELGPPYAVTTFYHPMTITQTSYTNVDADNEGG